MTQIRFFFLQKNFSLTNRSTLKDFIAALFKKEKTAFIGLNYIFCSDEYLLDINQQFLKHNTYTDIVTFNLAGQGVAVEGEIYISIDRVKENANSLGISFKKELHRVIFHGALHLCGYNDKLKAEKETMRNMEDRYLDLYFQQKR